MPGQTERKQNIYLPDGAKVSVKAAGDSVFYDVGAISSAVTSTLSWTENEVESANAGTVSAQIRKMIMEGGFTLINLDPVGIGKLGGGVFTVSTVAGTPTSSIDDQTISAGWADNTAYALKLIDSDAELRVSTQPVITSVTLDPSGTPEVLAEDTEYVITQSETGSGWNIQFISGNMSTGSPTTFDIEIVYGTNTPIASTVVSAGTSTLVLTSYELRIEHTDSAGLKRTLDLYAVNSQSGGFQFNYKGANEDGTEEMPISYKAQIDTSKTDGSQLFSYTVEEGAA
jgi:hypothetical protein